MTDEEIAKLNIYQRIREVKREVHCIDKKGKHAQGFSFTRHDDVTAALSGLFVKWGIDREVSITGATRVGAIIGMDVEVSWVNVDSPTDRKTVHVFAEGIDITRRSGELQTDGLASGKGLSYAVKMAELKNFCLVGDNTPDSERLGAPEASVVAPTESEYSKLKELYESCSSEEEFQTIRKMLTPLVNQQKLTASQVSELSKLDKEAKERIKK